MTYQFNRVSVAIACGLMLFAPTIAGAAPPQHGKKAAPEDAVPASPRSIPSRTPAEIFRDAAKEIADAKAETRKSAKLSYMRQAIKRAEIALEDSTDFAERRDMSMELAVWYSMCADQEWLRGLPVPDDEEFANNLDCVPAREKYRRAIELYESAAAEIVKRHGRLNELKRVDRDDDLGEIAKFLIAARWDAALAKDRYAHLFPAGSKDFRKAMRESQSAYQSAAAEFGSNPLAVSANLNAATIAGQLGDHKTAHRLALEIFKQLKSIEIEEADALLPLKAADIQAMQSVALGDKNLVADAIASGDAQLDAANLEKSSEARHCQSLLHFHLAEAGKFLMDYEKTYAGREQRRISALDHARQAAKTAPHKRPQELVKELEKPAK